MKKLLNRGFYMMLAAAALVTAALVTNCMGPVDGSGVGGGWDNTVQTFKPPAGMGYIRINLKEGDARATITPTMPTISSMYYDVVVTDDDDDDAVVYDSNDISGTPVLLSALTTNPILLYPGNYSVEVFAYKLTLPSTFDIVGYGVTAGESVTSGSGSPVSVTISPSNSDGNGGFSYNITLPSNNSAASGTFSAVLNVSTFPGDSQLTGIPAALINHNLLGGGNNNTALPATLPSGFYYLRIAMSDSGVTGPPAVPPALQSRTITHILHVYQNIETDYGTTATPITLAALNVYSYKVTYDENGGDSYSPTEFGPFAHGSTLTEYTDSPPLVSLTHPNSDFVFDGWHIFNGTPPTVKWVFGNSGTKLISPITLYAGWVEKLTVGLDISWASGPTIPQFTQPTQTLTQAGYYNGVPLSISISINTSTLGTNTVLRWLDENNVQVAGAVNTLTINAVNNVQYLSVGEPHVFYVFFSNNSSAEFTLNITPLP
jgi:hypothetical protein